MGRAFRIRISTGQNEVPVGMATVGDPHFLPVDDVMVSFLLSFGFDSGYV